MSRDNATAPFAVFAQTVAVVALVASTVSVGGCRSALTSEAATAQLLDSAFFKRKLTAEVTLYASAVRPCSDLVAEHPELTKLSEAGFIEFTPGSVVFGKEVGCRTALTAKGRQEAADWQPKPREFAQDDVYVAAVGRRELLGIRSLSKADDRVTVSFTWSWKLNAVGSVIGLDTREESGSAVFRYITGTGLTGWLQGSWTLDPSSLPDQL